MGRPQDLVDGLHHMDRNPDGPGLVGNGPADGLTNPPGGIGGEFITLGIIELLHGLNQAHIALLNQIQQLHAPAHVPLGNGHHQPQIGFGHLMAGFLVAVGHALGQLQLLFLGQQRNFADFLQIHAHGVVQLEGLGQGVGVLHYHLIGGVLQFLLRGRQLQRFPNHIHDVADVDFDARALQLFINPVRQFIIGAHGVQCVNQDLGGQFARCLSLLHQGVDFLALLGSQLLHGLLLYGFCHCSVPPKPFFRRSRCPMASRSSVSATWAFSYSSSMTER